MADPETPISPPPGRGPKPSGGDGILDKLRNLPRPAQIALGIVVVGVLYLMLSGGRAERTKGEAVNTTTASATRDAASGQVFSGIESDRPVLMQGWLEQNRREMSELKGAIQTKFEEKDKALAEALNSNAEMQSQMRQMMADFTAEIKNIQASSAQDRAMLGQLAEEQRKAQLNEPVDGVTGPGPVLRQGRKIEQTVLSGGRGGQVSGQPLLAPISGAVRTVTGDTQRGVRSTRDDGSWDGSSLDDGPAPLPFMPPLGFVKGTMLNGVDALIGGQPTPSLVRLSGVYKTAMGQTVQLDGCFALVEFQGEISTERAVGKPARMTCVYPDQGAVTYSLSGYVVDADDGIIGIPGVFYEGDASRIAAAMLADFAAGVSGVVKDNQSTVTVDSSGNATQSITGDELKGEIAGGVEKAVSSLRDYLMERVNRVLPFVRLDATRQLHLVLLSGTELRAEGSPWTLLFDAEAADAARARNERQTRRDTKTEEGV
jgi:hypothetical protein